MSTFSTTPNKIIANCDWAVKENVILFVELLRKWNLIKWPWINWTIWLQENYNVYNLFQLRYAWLLNSIKNFTIYCHLLQCHFLLFYHYLNYCSYHDVIFSLNDQNFLNLWNFHKSFGYLIKHILINFFTNLMILRIFFIQIKVFNFAYKNFIFAYHWMFVWSCQADVLWLCKNLSFATICVLYIHVISWFSSFMADTYQTWCFHSLLCIKT